MNDAVPSAPRTIAELPLFAAGRFSKADLVARCRAESAARLSGRQLADAVRDLSLGLSALGLTAGDRVALLSESRPDWLIADFAILAGRRHYHAGSYRRFRTRTWPSSLADRGATIALLSRAKQLPKVLGACSSGPLPGEKM